MDNELKASETPSSTLPAAPDHTNQRLDVSSAHLDPSSSAHRAIAGTVHCRPRSSHQAIADTVLAIDRHPLLQYQPPPQLSGELQSPIGLSETGADG